MYVCVTTETHFRHIDIGVIDDKMQLYTFLKAGSECSKYFASMAIHL